MIIQKDSEGRVINRFNSISQASKKLNFKRDAILRCCLGKQKKFKGYSFLLSK